MASKTKKSAARRRKAQERVRQRSQEVAIQSIAAGEFPSSDAIPRSELSESSFSTQAEAVLFFSLINLASRVADHIHRLDTGVVYAVDDLAVALRVLLRSGEGSGILLQAIDKFELEEPTILASTQVPADSAFGFGLLPIVEPLQGLLPRDAGDDTVLVGLNNWLTFRSIRYADNSGTRQDRSWRDFIGHYANRLSGAHLDPRPIPPYIQRMDWCGAGGLALSSYFLRMLGLQAYCLVQEALHEICEKIGVEVGEHHTFRGVGPDDEDHPWIHYQLGTLLRYSETESSVSFHWLVDDNSRHNRIRLYFNSAIWDYTYSSTDGLRAHKYLNPISEYLYQSPRYPVYSGQETDSLHISPHFVHLPIVQTLKDVRKGRRWTYPPDFHPNLPSPGWEMDPPATPGQVLASDHLLSAIDQNYSSIPTISPKTAERIVLRRREDPSFVIDIRRQGAGTEDEEEEGG